mmetsp:Transcript_95253/g.308508  ORF Transcript_95253/g.308508 Transcript_95253/m.308508 type:complete len:434 (+) Transcript_95253:62-1363(+)
MDVAILRGDAQLALISGLWGLCVLWNVCCRYLPDSYAGFWLTSKQRGGVAEAFVVLLCGYSSALVQETVHGPRRLQIEIRSMLSLGQNGFRSLWLCGCQAVLSVWLTTLLTLLVPIVEHAPLDLWMLTRCSLLIQPLMPLRAASCPCQQGLVIASLMPCWFMSPLMFQAFSAVGSSKGVTGLLFVGCMLWLPSCFVVMECREPQDPGSASDFTDIIRRRPETALVLFSLGIIAALIGRHIHSDSTSLNSGSNSLVEPKDCVVTDRSPKMMLCLGWISDITACSIGAAVLFLPPTVSWCTRLGVLNCFLTMPFFAFLCLLPPKRPHGGVMRLLQHKSLVSLGACAFEVYILQDVVFSRFEFLLPQSRSSPECFMAFLLCLWLVAGSFVELVSARLCMWGAAFCGLSSRGRLLDLAAGLDTQISSDSDASSDSMD